jgi:hypothetical protein
MRKIVMSTLRALIGAASFALLASVASPALAQAHTAHQAAVPNPYGAMSFLIGEWDTVGPNGANSIIQRFRWGPNEAYIWSSTSLVANGQEHLHFEGIIIWNFANNNADTLFALEPGSGTEEKGVIHIDADGTIVRDVTTTDAAGHTQTFRQTLRRTGDNTAVTSLMRQSPDGSWSPNFPGADHLVMVRRAG